MSVFIQFITPYSEQVIAGLARAVIEHCVSVFILVFILSINNYTLNYTTFEVFGGQEQFFTNDDYLMDI